MSPRKADPIPRERIEAQFDLTQISFKGAQFLASLQGFKGNMVSGAVDITFTVGPNEKDNALPITNAAGELLLITVERIRFDGSRG